MDYNYMYSGTKMPLLRRGQYTGILGLTLLHPQIECAVDCIMSTFECIMDFNIFVIY